MGFASRKAIGDLLMVLGVLAILTLLIEGQIAATVLVMLPLVVIALGERRH